MNSPSFKYSRLANPIILLIAGILGVIWGSTFFMVILLCIGLLLGLYDTDLKNNDSKILSIRAKLTSSEFLEGFWSLTVFWFVILVLFWYFGFWWIMLCLTWIFMRYAFNLQKELKATISRSSKNS